MDAQVGIRRSRSPVYGSLMNTTSRERLVMTDLKNFRATVMHQRPERILCYADFTPDLRRRAEEHAGTADLSAHYGMVNLNGIIIRKPADVPDLDFTAYWADSDLPKGTTIDEHGVAMVPSGYFHFWGYVSPLRNAQDISELENYPVPDINNWDLSDLPGQVARRHAEGRIAGGWIGHMYEDSWQIRGYEQFLMDMVERPAWAECLLERLMQRNMQRAIAFARAGVDLVRCGDDVANQRAMMFSPDTWRRMMLSRWRQVWRAIREINPACQIWYHSDGNISAIVEDLIEAGVNILNPLQPEALDLTALHQRYGKQLTFDGCVGTQSTMPFGTPDDVRARVKELIACYGQEGGLILSPTHVLEPDVPLANVDAFFAACQEYGTFG
jgi:uroporphyrinogen decarboxylase